MRIEKLQSNMEKAFLKAISYGPTGGFRAIGQISDSWDIIACVGYDHWTPNSVQMHIWIPRPQEVSRKFFQEGFRYPFEMCGKGLVVGLTPSNNTAALHFNQRVGFKEVYRMKDAWDVGTDVVVQEMRKENCRWLRGRHGNILQNQKVSKEDDQNSGSDRAQATKIDGRILHGSSQSIQ